MQGDDSMYGEIENVDGQWQLRFRRRLAHRPEKVWRALTEPEDLAAWFPTTIDGERAPGAVLAFRFPGEAAAPLSGEMLAYDPPHHMQFSWGEDVVRFELESDGDGTILTLVDLIAERGKGARDAAGWHVCLDNLDRHLAGEPPIPDDAWASKNEEYQRRMGPEASTMGPPEGKPA
jgi:uncharacterized protein YndB with AHSA1/START domain